MISAIPWNRVVNATQPIRQGLPCWPGDPVFESSVVSTIESAGYFLRQFCMGEHSGTHITTPNSFFVDGVCLEKAYAWPLCAPLVVLDVRHHAKNTVDYACSIDDIIQWEAQHGRIPIQAFVACNTGWHRFWNDESRFLGLQNGELHFPAFLPETLEFLCSKRSISGVGIDTHGIDLPSDSTFRCNHYAHTVGCVVVECVGSLDAVPAVGAWVIVSPLLLEGGSGAPATVTVLIP